MYSQCNVLMLNNKTGRKYLNSDAIQSKLMNRNKKNNTIYSITADQQWKVMILKFITIWKQKQYG